MMLVFHLLLVTTAAVALPLFQQIQEFPSESRFGWDLLCQHFCRGRIFCKLCPPTSVSMTTVTTVSTSAITSTTNPSTTSSSPPPPPTTTTTTTSTTSPTSTTQPTSTPTPSTGMMGR